ncbi:MAG: F0F1 ATP synthase subunit alpha [Parachlamydiaceae bacterium]|nr:F0F1 ATP synthase subunit alpha [Parachlamydiaceae bacterium]
MTLKSGEISWIIKEAIENFKESHDFQSTGRVLQIGDGIARIWGLDDVMISEIVEFPNGTLGMVLNLEKDEVGVVLFGSDEGIKEHDIVKRTGKIVSVPVGHEFLGRVVDPLGVPIDGKGPIHAEAYLPIESTAPNVIERQPVNQPLQTGIKAIDAMIPIGKGQRELIIGDRQVGKTTLILDTIINQKDKDVICIYVAIGQKASNIVLIADTLKNHGALQHTIIVAASASIPAPLQYIAPYAATAMGEFFMRQGKHAVCFYDDLSKHAQAYRQLSLLLRRPPGREAYPGDIFYLHSRLLERSAKLSDELGGGSLTALPVVETQAQDVTTYIPTNVISITDGQIYLEADLFFSGIRPAINPGISASRVGSKAQTKAMKKVASHLRLDIAQYRELAAFTQFGSELDDVTKGQITRGERMVEILKQDKYVPYPLDKQVIIIFVGTKGHLDDIPLNLIHKFEKEFFEFIKTEYLVISHSINQSGDLDQKTMEEIEKAVTQFKPQFMKKHGLRGEDV